MKRVLAALGAVLLLLAAALWWLNVRGDGGPEAAAGELDIAAQVERGAYLARAGNCQDCHTQRGAAP
jgi:mono/diheme cytochrome c family protein